MSSITLRRCTIERKSGKTMYDGIVDEPKALGDTNLCAHELDATFIRAKPDFSGNIYYENFDGTPFVASFIAEIGSQAQGTWMAAYPKNSPPASKLPYTDVGSKSHRMVLALRCPTAAPDQLRTMFVNGAAVCDTIRAADEAQEKERGENFDVTECITCGEGEGGSEAVEDIVLLLRLHKTYEVPNDNSKDNSSSAPRTPRKRITKVDSTEESSEKSDNLGDVDMDAAAQVIERQVGDTYPPNRLPDHKGPYFAHDKAKLVQRDYRDVDGSLIAPHELYEKLTEGTLVLVMVSLVTYVITGQTNEKGEPMTNKKIYHILVERLKILDHGDGQPWSPAVPALPEGRHFSAGTPSRKRPRDNATDIAFDNFGSKATPSPPKRTRQGPGRK
ncbi:hypothetical protein FB451DRAFT_1243090 [Mycena latifolia]|nr:hypothetical protein FB451DRAFT_765111 [Mycena latifolia]KAJ7477731.1 hypothetical protein FB451DRAFT_1243090 [Mycena latifolia]